MNASNQDTTLDGLHAKIDQLTEMVGVLTARSQAQQELIDELIPIGRKAMGVAAENLTALETRGYFSFAREAVGVADEIVTNYSAEDVRLLGKNIVGILDTVRRLTQPDVLAIAADATAAIDNADDVEPRGVLGMLRETRDPEVKRGVAMALEVLRHVGRGTARLQAPERERSPARAAATKQDATQAKLERLLGPKRKPAAASPPRQPAPARAAVGPKRGGGAPSVISDAESCSYIQGTGWTRELATQRAADVGVAKFTEQHWLVIRFARTEFEQTKASPNVRRIVKGSGVDTRTLYALFPNAPGISVAYCAGIPKPGGCL